MDGFFVLVNLKLFLQDVGSGFEFHNLLSSDLDVLASSGVTALSGGTIHDSHGTKTYEADLTTFFQFAFGDIEDGINSFSCVNFGHASFCSNGID